MTVYLTSEITGW